MTETKGLMGCGEGVSGEGATAGHGGSANKGDQDTSNPITCFAL